jgi:hypothetical protein
MRRSVANSLLLLFFSLLIAPFSPADSSSNLPECCRRGGAHHCAAVASVLNGETALHSQNACPMQRHGHAATSSAALPVAESAAILAQMQPLTSKQLAPAVSFSRQAGRERAPPIELS